jgi:hypothetical protein
MTPDARVLRFPSAVGAMVAEDYGRFSRELSPDELAGCFFFFTDDDRARIASRRRDANRLGFAVQLGTVRYLGRFLENPADVPASVLRWTIRDIGVATATSLDGYGEREARWEHQKDLRHEMLGRRDRRPKSRLRLRPDPRRTGGAQVLRGDPRPAAKPSQPGRARDGESHARAQGA